MPLSCILVSVYKLHTRICKFRIVGNLVMVQFGDLANLCKMPILIKLTNISLWHFDDVTGIDLHCNQMMSSTCISVECQNINLPITFFDHI